MRKELLVVCTPEVADVGNRTISYMKRYADKHGYKLVLETKKHPVVKDRHASWSKIAYACDHMFREKDPVDVILILDVDVLIVDESLDIADIEDNCGSPDVMTCTHWTKAHGHIPNTGVVVLRRSMATWAMLVLMLSGIRVPRRFENVYEQGAFYYILHGLDKDLRYPLEFPFEYKCSRNVDWWCLGKGWNYAPFLDEGLEDGVYELRQCKFMHFNGLKKDKVCEEIDKAIGGFGL